MSTARMLLSVVVVWFAAFPTVAGELSARHDESKDERMVLELTAGERAMILAEMRAFLAGVQGITGALAGRDMGAVATHARGLGQSMVHEVPPALRAKLPMAFRQLGFSVHGDFDQIAADAESMSDPAHTLRQLSSALQKCVACHSAYQIRAESAGGHGH